MEPLRVGMHQWIRLRSSRALGVYEVLTPRSLVEKAEWPEVAFAGLLRVAFKDRFIRSLDHPVLRQLRGE